MKRILVLFAHPSLRRSRVQKVLAEAAREVDGVTFHDLYEAYPDFYIQVKREQELLAAHDVVILQHPFHWYSTPAIFKQWQDLVLEHGWAYGVRGRRLEGKWWMHVISTGGTAESYAGDGLHTRTMRQFLAPLQSTAELCRMIFLPPYVVHGTFGMTDEVLEAHALGYTKLLESLRGGTLEVQDLLRHDTLTASSRILGPSF